MASPSSTLEDRYVTAAVMAKLLREARARGWPEGLRERLTVTRAALATVASGTAVDPGHFVLALGSSVERSAGMPLEG